MGDVGNLVWRERPNVLVAQHEPQPRGRLKLLDRIRGGGERRPLTTGPWLASSTA